MAEDGVFREGSGGLAEGAPGEGVREVDHPPGGKDRARDRWIAAIAARQHGTVARQQLLRLGYTSREIERRIEAGLLHVVHRGVYAVGHRKLTQKGRWMAAVLAGAENAVLSHRDAVALHGLRWARSTGAVHVSVPGGSRKPRPGLTSTAPDTRSHNERRFLALIREAGLPTPSTNVVVAGEVVDFYWPSRRLVVEVDGYRFHHTPADRAADRRKERTLRAAGCHVHRVTDEELGEPAVADVAAILSAGEAAAGR